jgi:hypothetical protein
VRLDAPIQRKFQRKENPKMVRQDPPYGTTGKAARSACHSQESIARDQHLLCLRHPDNLKEIVWATLRYRNCS